MSSLFSLSSGGQVQEFIEFPIANSLRFDDGTTAYLQNTLGSGGNRKTWTFSAWVKRGVLTTNFPVLFSSYVNTQNYGLIRFDSSDRINIVSKISDANGINLSTTAVFRDVNAWYHIVVAVDTTQSTNTNRVKLYVNGNQITNFSTSTYPIEDYSTIFNYNITHYIGRYGGNTTGNFDGYMTEVNFVDGLQLTQDSFGILKNGVWMPTNTSGLTFGTNGFRLQFNETSSTTKFSDDFADNLNDWTSDGTGTFTVSSGNLTVASYGTNNGGYHGAKIYTDVSSHNLTDFRFIIDNLTVGNVGSDIHQTIIKLTDSSGADIFRFYFADSHTNTGNSNSVAITDNALLSAPNITLSNEYFVIDRIGSTIIFNSSRFGYYTVTSANTNVVDRIYIEHNKYQTYAAPNMTLGGISIGSLDAYQYADTSGNGQYFDPYGFNDHDIVTDSPTNNFATFSSLVLDDFTLSKGNLKTTSAVAQLGMLTSTISCKGQKFYCEIRVDVVGNGTIIGIVKSSHGGTRSYSIAQLFSLYYSFGGAVYKFGSSTGDTFASYTAGDVIGMAIDGINGTIQFLKNGSLQGTITEATIATEDYLIYCSNATTSSGNSSAFTANFGQDSTFAGSETIAYNTDSNGIGEFHHTVPTDFLAMCTKNIEDQYITPKNDVLPEDFFDTMLWIGNAPSTQTINLLQFSPNFIWLKNRDHTDWNNIFDTVRGRLNRLSTNETDGENSYTDDTSAVLTAITSNGFSVGTNSNSNRVDDNFVAWNWKAGGDAPTQTYTVKVVSDGGNKYRFDDFGTSAVTLDLQEGGTYIFNMDDSSNANHPFSIGTAANATVYNSGITYFLDGVSKTYAQYTSGFASASTRRLHFTVPASAPTLYYWCSVHSGMGGQINTNVNHGSSNFLGSIQSTVSANTISGMSIVTYTGTGGDQTFGHGLSGADMVIVKCRSHNTTLWPVIHKDVPASKYLNLESTIAETDSESMWNSTYPSSTVVSIGGSSHTSTNARTYVAYCFQSIESYSKIGSYIGNGAADGTFVYTGFRPAFVIVKRSSATSSASGWFIVDKARNPFNLVDNKLNANSEQEENDSSTIGVSGANDFDFLSNGFKTRATNAGTNTSGNTYIYLAFAEMPFKYANAR